VTRWWNWPVFDRVNNTEFRKSIVFGKSTADVDDFRVNNNRDINTSGRVSFWQNGTADAYIPPGITTANFHGESFRPMANQNELGFS